jgi:hypothetical protein
MKMILEEVRKKGRGQGEGSSNVTAVKVVMIVCDRNSRLG